MDKKVLNKHIGKLNEDIRNIQYQINSINQDMKKDKKQSYIEKRIDRLVNNYKMLNQKRQELVNISREEKRELQEKVLEIRKQVYYNSSYLYFLTHELFADNPEIAHKIDEKIKNLNFNYNNSSTDKNIK